MTKFHHIASLFGLMLLAACGEEPPPISVGEFMENPRLLEATMVRCAQNRSESRYLVECINARDAVNRIEAAQEKLRREEFEKQSERKRQALRRTQEAAAEARRRALDAQRRRETEDYLGIYDHTSGTPADSPTNAGETEAVLADPASNAPMVEVEPQPSPDANETVPEVRPQEAGTDLGAIREELKRRQDENN